MNSNKDTKCDVCAMPSFERNKYFYGKQLTVRDLLHEQRYLNEKRWLINRTILGWGVVCGLGVRWSETKREIIIDQGLAIDCCGHEIVVCEPRCIKLSEYEEWCQQNRDDKGWPLPAVLCLEYFECDTEPVELPPLYCEDKERSEFNRRRESFKLRLRRLSEVKSTQPYGHVACLEHLKQPHNPGEYRDPCALPTIHQHLCEHLAKGCPQCPPCACVVLATVTIPPPSTNSSDQVGRDAKATLEQEQKAGSCDKWPDPHLDSCTDRRLVYNNSLLYDLIYCHHGDLPHIVNTNWLEHKGELAWEKFCTLLKEGLVVTFDKEMKAETLNTHTFSVAFSYKEEGTGNFVVKRIPGVVEPPTKEGNCWGVKFTADPDWQADELQSRNSELIKGVDVEITLHGSRIRSAEGKQLDGEFNGERLPSGNGVQGGNFFDWFRVRPREDKR